MIDVLFSDVTLVALDEAKTILEHAYVGVTGKKISYVGTLPPQEVASRELKKSHMVLMPALCNTHTHIPMILLRGYADDYELSPWLNDHIVPAEAKIDDEMVYWASLLAAMECISSGTGSITDMYDHALMVGKAIAESGMKANLTRGVLYFGDPSVYDFENDFRIQETKELVEQFHQFDEGRIRVDASIHAEYTSSPPQWKKLSQYALDKGLGMHIHLSETYKEHSECIEKYGVTPAQVLSREGVFDVRATCAHCVHVTDDDIALLASKKATAVHNPISNLKLASGVARVPAMLSAGLNVALGTDGMASNNSHDMFEEIKTAAIVQKNAVQNPAILSTWQVLRMASHNGFVSQGRENSGSIEVGNDADLILLDFDKAHLIPVHHVDSSLCYSARGSDVYLTMVNGNILYENGSFQGMDEEKIKAKVQSFVSRF
jgi:5-methylthioadenosine/S-adenosylhomocysteine deaminase